MVRLASVPGLAGLAAIAVASTASAAPVLRVQVDQHGDFALIGNTLGYECATGTPAPVVGTVGNCGNSTADTAPDIFWRADAPAAGQAQANNTVTVAQARSTSMLTLPAGATVTHAFLYWGATNTTGTADTQITLDRPGAGGFTQSVDAIASYTSFNNSYQSVADVTSLVTANGPGAYRVSGVDVVNLVNRNNENDFGGWWMAVFYQLASDPPRNLALFDGLDPVYTGNNQNVTISGFLVPNAGYTAKLGVITFEGDNAIVGDQLFFNGGAALSDAQNPADNFFNGTRSNLGAAVSVAGDLPQLKGTAQSMAGMDLDVVDVTSKVTAGQTSAPIQATTTGDVYYLGGFVTSISTYKPDFTTSTKTATDVNGGALLRGRRDPVLDQRRQHRQRRFGEHRPRRSATDRRHVRARLAEDHDRSKRRDQDRCRRRRPGQLHRRHAHRALPARHRRERNDGRLARHRRDHHRHLPGHGGRRRLRQHLEPGHDHRGRPARRAERQHADGRQRRRAGPAPDRHHGRRLRDRRGLLRRDAALRHHAEPERVRAVPG